MYLSRLLLIHPPGNLALLDSPMTERLSDKALGHASLGGIGVSR